VPQERSGDTFHIVVYGRSDAQARAIRSSCNDAEVPRLRLRCPLPTKRERGGEGIRRVFLVRSYANGAKADALSGASWLAEVVSGVSAVRSPALGLIGPHESRARPGWTGATRAAAAAYLPPPKRGASGVFVTLEHLHALGFWPPTKQASFHQPGMVPSISPKRSEKILQADAHPEGRTLVYSIGGRLSFTDASLYHQLTWTTRSS
jgi:hypothetical protein